MKRAISSDLKPQGYTPATGTIEQLSAPLARAGINRRDRPARRRLPRTVPQGARLLGAEHRMRNAASSSNQDIGLYRLLATNEVVDAVANAVEHHADSQFGLFAVKISNLHPVMHHCADQIDQSLIGRRLDGLCLRCSIEAPMQRRIREHELRERLENPD